MSRLLRDIDDAGFAAAGSFIVHHQPARFRAGVAWRCDGSGDGDGDAGVATFAATYGADEDCGSEAQHIVIYDELHEALRQTTRAVGALRPEPPGQLALIIAEAVFGLVRQICGETGIDQTQLLARAKAAAALVEDVAKPARLCVSSEDLPFFDAIEMPVMVVADPAMARGSVRIETAHGSIEDSIEQRLAHIRRAMDSAAAGL